MQRPTPEHFDQNHALRTSCVESIIEWQYLAQQHKANNRNSLYRSCVERIVQAEQELFILNKDYDAMMEYMVVAPEASEPKTLIKKLLRK